MPTPYYDKFMRLSIKATCPGCGNDYPLQTFRKWWGHKRVLRNLCVFCEPEKSLTDMTPRERVFAMDNQRPYATPARVAALNDPEKRPKPHRSLLLTNKKTNKGRRTRAWAPLISTLTRERDWCFDKRLAPTVHPAWKEFFAAYETALNDAIAKAKHQRSQVSRLEPTELESDPMHWLYPETKGRLKELYSACPLTRGRRSYREPLFLGEFSPPPVSAAAQR